MKKIFFVFIFGIFFIGLISASGIQICIDHTPPSAPSNLAVSGDIGNILLTWDPATDEPSCSGIEHYNVYRNGVMIGTTSSNVLSFTDNNAPYGTYSYSVNAVDKVAHNSGLAIKNDVVLSQPNQPFGGAVSGGGGASSYVCVENWDCGNWSSCINGTQTRTCTDSAMCGTTLTKPETERACSPNFVPLSGNQSTVNSSTLNLRSSSSNLRPLGVTRLTGAVVGALVSRGGKTTLIALFGLGIGIVIFFIFKKNPKFRFLKIKTG